MLVALALLEAWWHEWKPPRFPVLGRQALISTMLSVLVILLPEHQSVAWAFDRHRQQFFMAGAVFLIVSTCDGWLRGHHFSRHWTFWLLWFGANVISRLPQYQAWQTEELRWAGYFLCAGIYDAMIFAAMLVVRPWRRL